MNLSGITNLLEKAHAEGRTRLFEHECYALLRDLGAEGAPRHRVLAPGERPDQAHLDALPGDKVVLKIVSEDIIHKTEAGGVRIVQKELAAVTAAFEAMLRESPDRYGDWLTAKGKSLDGALAGLSGADLKGRLAERVRGVLLTEFVQADAKGFATELFVGVRDTGEFGPVLSAGYGGVEMELLAERSRPGAAVAIAPTGLVDGARFLELFKGTYSYERLSGRLRGAERLVADAQLEAAFQAFIDVANHFSAGNPDAPFHLNELEVNPFQLAGGKIAPLDGVCSFRQADAPATPRPLAKIGHLLEPRSAAVIGVSEKGMNMGRIILNNIAKAGFDKERLYVVRPGTDRIDGLRCVPSVADLPEKVDLFVVAVGSDQVPAVVEALIDHDKANAVVLIPGGLGEKVGSQDVERRLKDKIQAAHREGDGGPVFIGGNSLGVVSHPGHYDTFFIPETKLAKSRGDHDRKVCFLSQSGAFIISNTSRMPWLDPAFALSIGNQVDLTAGDILSYVKNDPRIELVAVYMEGFRPGDGLAFAKAVRETIALGKDVVFYKAGRTTEGRSATAGHTASVAGDYAVCEAALKEAGAFVAGDFNEFSDLLRITLRLRGTVVRGRRLGALSNAGFEAVGMADGLRSEGDELSLTTYTEATAARLTAVLSEHRLDGLVDVKNPLDLTPMASDAAYADATAALIADDNVDALAVGIVPLTPAMQTLGAGEGHAEDVTRPESFASRLPGLVRDGGKPTIAVIDSGERFDTMAEHLEAQGVPVFRSADRAVRALCKYVNVRLRRER